jgi:ABC-type polysaccharide/polyol phosphate export permease
MSVTAVAQDAASDFVGTAKAFRIWNLLAIQDIRQRYRRSVLGPFWITLSTLVSIAALGLVYTKIFKTPIDDYLPFLTVGFIAWSFISALVMESCAVFIGAEGIIKQINLPFGVHVMRMVWRNLIMLAHHSVVVVLVLIYAGITPTMQLFYLPFSLVLVTVTGVFSGYLLGAICARYRDIAPIVTSLMQVVFYVTPVIWYSSLLKGSEWLLVMNPFFHFLEILRAPVLGSAVEHHSFRVCLGITLVLGAASMLFMYRFKKRIAYWL